MIAAWHTLPDVERCARLRALQALTRDLAGPAGRDLVELLRNPETDTEALATCDAALGGLGTIARRRILSTFAATLPIKTEVIEGLRSVISPQETRFSVPPLPRRDKRMIQGR